MLFLLLGLKSQAQLPPDSIREEDATTILQFLASDSLAGRGNPSSGLTAAADFIAGRFSAAGLRPFPGLDSFFHPFSVNKGALTGDKTDKDILQNVVGLLEGKTKPAEVVIFSAHYDHLGTKRRTIYNGANDNASGTTALLLLADYFARRADNERTILFCAFAGEELGLLGSEAFVPLLKPETVVAVINIEMIGIPAVGKNALFITGARHSGLAEVFRRNLPKPYKIRQEPNDSKELFRRSDNYPFAKKGIPAHSFMASDDDDDCYHRPCDDVKRIDLSNLTRLTQALVWGSETLVNGKDTPGRVKAEAWW